ncbi:MAG: Qat anti-phage system QueC-like protein QatC, partial [Thermodesulfobacteriota bacterium]
GEFEGRAGEPPLPRPSPQKTLTKNMPFNLYLRAPGERRRPSEGMEAIIHLDETGVPGYPLHHNFGQLLVSPQPPGEVLEAFLLAALGVWAGDKFFPRKLAADAWTREIVLHLPTAAPWVPLVPRLAPLLNFLTGDKWTLKPREVRVDLGFSGSWTHSWLPDAVCLLSGGLDSLIGAIDLLEKGQRLILVSHYDYGQLASSQQALAAALATHYGPDAFYHLALRVQFPETREFSLRSRSLLFLALGVTVAGAFPGNLPLVVPENGWISLNPPLTLSRLGTYSTRTTHPYFLHELTALWREAGIATPLLNPYQHLAKGEMLARCRNPGLLKKLYSLTSSCARPEVGRWQRQAAGACGYCYPCLIRRAALHRLGWDEGNDYRRDVLSAPEILRQRVQGSDLRALLLGWQTWEASPQEMEARLLLAGAPTTLPEQWTAAHRVLSAGFEEIGHLLQDKAPKLIKAYLGQD